MSTYSMSPTFSMQELQEIARQDAAIAKSLPSQLRSDVSNKGNRLLQFGNHQVQLRVPVWQSCKGSCGWAK
jgi:hypothetical protein